MARKNALVTGASSGIGRSIAIMLAANGYNVAVNYCHNAEGARQVCELVEGQGAKAHCIKADVRQVEQIRDMFTALKGKFEKLHLLVNNAGITRFKPLLDVTEDDWFDLTATNWLGPYFCTQQAALWMIATGTKGGIINITSIHQSCCFSAASIYGPNKAALAKFTQHAALELSKYGIRVNAVAPGCTLVHHGEDQTERGKRIKSRIPLQRYAQADEVAKAVLYLASPDSEYVTGTCLSVDGGALLPSVLENKFV